MASPGGLLVESAYSFYVSNNGGYNSALPIATSSTLTGGNAVITGNLTAGSITGTITPAVPLNLSGANANAFSVGANGTTNPVLNVDSSVSSAATGLNIQGEAAGSGVNLSVISSGTNENLSIAPKGSGGVVLTAASANALAVGQNGVTNPAFLVIDNAPSQANGVSITANATGNGPTIACLSSASSESINVNAKGSATVFVGTASTNTGLQVGGGSSLTTASLIVKSSTTTALAVGPNGSTNPGLLVNANTASSATGVSITSAASGSGIALATISSGTNESLTIAAKGTGTVTVNPSSTLTSGGLASSSIQVGASSIGVYVGTGAPTIAAAQGSIYLNNAGSGIANRVYVNSNGSTTWVAVTTAS